MAPQVLASSEGSDSVSCDVLVIGACRAGQSSDGVSLDTVGRDVDRALDGYMTQYLEEIGFKAGAGDITTLPTYGRIAAKSIAVVGMGDSADIASVRRSAAAAARRLAERSVIASGLHSDCEQAGGAAAAAEGFVLGSYRFTRYKSDPHPSKVQRLILLGDPPGAELERAVARAEAAMLARDLTNEPAGYLSPEELAARITEIADVAGLACAVMDERELADGGYGGIVGVGQGSAHPPRLVILRYAPDRPAGKVALVGKGITFDSGGLSLKPASSMEEMKTDMAGAAAVVGALSVCKRLDIGVEVVGVVAAAENMPSSTSFRPGDVLRHYGGKTTEVTNTDAEGRLVLADALARISEERPDAVIDVATLTGAIKVALGSKAVGLFTNDDGLAREMEEAATAAGERVWRMPLYDDYLKELDSEVADHKNSAGRWGASIIAALFLKEFVGEGIPWAHLDIAGAARAESAYGEVSKGGTGIGTRTLISWLERRGAGGDSADAAETH